MDGDLPLALSLAPGEPTEERTESTESAERVERTERAASVARAGAGDREAFDQLARAEWRELVRLARIVMAGDAEAEDVAQETLVDAWRHLGALRDPERFGAWLRRSLVRRAIRRLKNRPRYADAPEPAGAEKPELLVDVERLLARLPARCRAAFFLTEIDGASDREAARRLGISPATVRVQRFLARRRLRHFLEGGSK